MIMMTWSKTTIKTIEDIKGMIHTFKELKPDIGGYDTETNGLHIISCKPFLLAFGFVNTQTKKGHTYTVDLRNQILKINTMYTIQKLFKKLEKVVAWNAKFDMHMMENVGYKTIFKDNITDAMIHTRLAHDALSKRQGGLTGKLKDYATRYIDPNAKYHEKLVKSEIAKRTKERNVKLKQMLNKDVPLLEEYKITGREKSWTMKMVEELLKDKVIEIEDLDPKLQPILKHWLEITEDPNDYSKLPIEIVEPYAHYDVIYTIEAYIQAKEVALARGQKDTIKLEENLIMPLFRMEKVGFSFNREYALESKKKVKEYILSRRKELQRLSGKTFTVGQHEVIKDTFLEVFNIKLDSTGQDVLNNLKIEDPKAQKFIDIIVELRSLEKWYSTYIIRYLNEEVNGRIYTTINQTGTVSGRVSSGFQQFPRDPIKDIEGNELFHPRNLVKVSEGKYDRMIFIDYSQVELRMQAMYTLMVKHGDTNMCRAYMPYKCFRMENNKKVLYYDSDLKDWNKYDWYLLENPDEKWEKIDLHSLTTLTAFPNVSKDDPDFKSWRYIGKTGNFAINYGAYPDAISRELHVSKEVAQNLFNAYSKNFPGVMKYRTVINQMISREGYVSNIYGRNYYGISGHLAANYLVQGSAADFLKTKMIEVDKFLQDYKTRYQMNIHDELMFEFHRDDPENLPYKIKEIMEDLPGALVPIVADLEITNTTWAEKRNL